MKHAKSIMTGILAAGLAMAQADEKNTERKAQFEKVGALANSLVVRVTYEVPKQINNEGGAGGIPDYYTIQKLYNKAYEKPRSDLDFENSKPAEQRMMSAMDEANAKIKLLNDMWAEFSQRQWNNINTKINKARTDLAALQSVLNYSVRGQQDNLFASGIDMPPVIALLEAISKRSDEIIAEAESGYLALWRKTLAEWEAVAK